MRLPYIVPVEVGEIIRLVEVYIFDIWSETE